MNVELNGDISPFFSRAEPFRGSPAASAGGSLPPMAAAPIRLEVYLHHWSAHILNG